MICQNKGALAKHIKATHSGSEVKDAIPSCYVKASKTVLTRFSSCCCISKKLEPGKLDPEKMTFTRKVALVPGEGEHKVEPDTLAIILASKRTIDV